MSENERTSDSEDAEVEDEPASPTRTRLSAFLDGHAKRRTHGISFVSDPSKVVINFVGRVLPRKDHGDREMYCKTMLTFFCPGGWRIGREMKLPDESWDDAFARHTFSEDHVQIMKNMNVLYECQDSRDDHSARRRAGMDGGLGTFLNADDEEALDRAQDDQQLVDEHGIQFNPDILDMLAEESGKTYSARAVQMQTMRDMMTRIDAEASSNFQRSDVDPPLESPALPTKSPVAWKDMLTSAKNDIIRRRREHRAIQLADGASAPAQGHARDHDGDVAVLSLHDLATVRQVNSSIRLSGTGPDAKMEYFMDKHSLNTEQRRAFVLLAHHLMHPEEPQLLMYLGGRGGTGKSEVIKCVMAFLEDRRESHLFVLAAPTGSAACQIGGSTYHQILSFGRDGEVTGLNKAGQVRDRLGSARIMCIDEISMVSTMAFYRICSQLCNAFMKPSQAFGGLSMLVAGDFAQLPPPGKGEAPLYCSKHSLATAGQTLYRQKVGLGRSLWHLFTTVVILRENMRQRGISDEDQNFRNALDNLRYRACTPQDVKLLRTRVGGTRQGQPHMGMPQFRDISIITAWNTHRDAINEVSAERFAQENSVQLHRFYSVDSLTEPRRKADSTKPPRKNKFKVMTPTIRELLWRLPPASTEHVPGILLLCIGMPVLLKHNDATELCATNGAEAHVVGWDATPLAGERQRLLTVFVRLHKPPRHVQLPGLPENVLPITASIQRVKCDLPDDCVQTIRREQVWLLPNFAMTDFASQGRTRPFNPVDIRYSRTHQSIYTCLSRSATLQGTLILKPFDESKLRGGMAPDLAREMRELEILDFMTNLKLDGKVYLSTEGLTRSQVIGKFHSMYGSRYVPDAVPAPLNWSTWPAFLLRPPLQPTEWGPVSSAGKHNTDGEDDLAAATGTRKRPKILETVSSSTAVIASTSGVGQASTAMAIGKVASRPSALPHLVSGYPRAALIGLKWDAVDWSCAYDTLLTVMFNTRHDFVGSRVRLSDQNPITKRMYDDFDLVASARLPFERMRDCLRDTICVVDDMPRRGPTMSYIDAVIDACLQSDVAYAHVLWRCTDCGVEADPRPVTSYVWSIGMNTDIGRILTSVSTAQLLWSVMADTVHTQCYCCASQTSYVTSVRLLSVPPIICLEIPSDDERFPSVMVDRYVELALGVQTVPSRLFGVIYEGGNHFTCRFLLRDGSTWYHDSDLTGSACQMEVGLDDSLLSTAHGRRACIYMYSTLL